MRSDVCLVFLGLSEILPDLLRQIWQEFTLMILPGVRKLFVLPSPAATGEESCIRTFSDVTLVSFVLQTRYRSHLRFLLSLKFHACIHYIYSGDAKCLVLWHCASAQVDRVLFFRFLALVSLSPLKKILVFFSCWHLHILSTSLWHVGAFAFDKWS